jgi:uncharacterized protein YdhG (YjbR/CyaY superfamily)
MASSAAKTVTEYLAELPDDRRATISRVRAVLRKNVPKGVVETMNWGMISYEIPLKRYPETYNGHPLTYAGLASQKNACSLYLMTVYMDPALERRLREAFQAAGLKLDMGKSCVRFRKADDLPLEEIGAIVGTMSVEAYVERSEAIRKKPAKR